MAYVKQNQNKGGKKYLPRVKFIEDKAIFKCANTKVRLEVIPAFPIGRLEIKCQGYEKGPDGEFHQTGTVSTYIEEQEVDVLLYKIDHGCKPGKDGMLYKAPTSGTDAEALNQRGEGRNGFAEYREFSISRGQKGWIFTVMSCDGVEKDGLYQIHYGPDKRPTGMRRYSIALSSNYLIGMAGKVSRALIGHACMQWTILGLAQKKIITDEQADNEIRENVKNAGPAFAIDDYGEVVEPAASAGKTQETSQAPAPQPSTSNYDGLDFSEEDLLGW